VGPGWYQTILVTDLHNTDTRSRRRKNEKMPEKWKKWSWFM